MLLVALAMREATYPLFAYSLSQFTTVLKLFPNLNVSTTCNSEVTYDRKSRFDMRWATSLPGKNNVTFAILEFKTTEVLHRRDALLGVCTSENAEENMEPPQLLRVCYTFATYRRITNERH